MHNAGTGEMYIPEEAEPWHFCSYAFIKDVLSCEGHCFLIHSSEVVKNVAMLQMHFNVSLAKHRGHQCPRDSSTRRTLTTRHNRSRPLLGSCIVKHRMRS